MLRTGAAFCLRAVLAAVCLDLVSPRAPSLAAPLWGGWSLRFRRAGAGGGALAKLEVHERGRNRVESVVAGGERQEGMACQLVTLSRAQGTHLCRSAGTLLMGFFSSSTRPNGVSAFMVPLPKRAHLSREKAPGGHQSRLAGRTTQCQWCSVAQGLWAAGRKGCDGVGGLALVSWGCSGVSSSLGC